MPSRQDRIEWEISAMRQTSDMTDAITKELSLHLRVLETAIMEFITKCDCCETLRQSCETLRQSILKRIEVWMKADSERPELPLLFSVELYDWLYPQPVPSEPVAKRVFKVYCGDLFTEVAAVSADAALHAITVAALLDMQFESGDAYHKAYLQYRSSLRTVEVVNAPVQS